ncbi:GNAT family N-acetyltransferase [Aureibacillus halotolerans]|uniref:RimJ/RimL family protein N-acetyltransferase n=1 Tax=Aureibacillus halotolerans TaxID=1508390 RepID=A0A4R6TTY0_9BACI|nr:GNAT family protein [Aureibacillus halotolerans]TDQ37150.1 RimJ/RimL family protein N-acetyltransferase [Aureibacillus halotolerans]
MSTTSKLTGKHIYLRPLELKDAALMAHSINNDEEGRRLTGTHKVFTETDIERAIEAFSQDPSRVDFGIVRREDDRLIGDIVLNEISAINRDAGMRVALFDKFTGKGHGTEAIQLMLEYGFGILNLHRVDLEVYSINPRAIHVYEKIGFKKEGVKRQNWYYNHEYYDTVLMSILEDEYRERYVEQ